MWHFAGIQFEIKLVSIIFIRHFVHSFMRFSIIVEYMANENVVKFYLNCINVVFIQAIKSVDIIL